MIETLLGGLLGGAFRLAPELLKWLDRILRQMMPPENRLVSALAKENGISEQTLYTWRRNLQSQGVPVPGNGKNAIVWSSADKFGVVLETARMNEGELAQYCRGKGLFVEQVTDQVSFTSAYVFTQPGSDAASQHELQQVQISNMLDLSEQPASPKSRRSLRHSKV
ncbi:helix-turn-helix domain-containing protein [Massilia sp. PWRC2]|uniref:helix-turn-helix domain-containing protein n=1 Tax=Massilia sp. PWRC2 TaxID=2804626 RepID=UPI003CFACB18